ncbi:kinesin-like protein KIF26B, partial [Tachysurus ichikawai]
DPSLSLLLHDKLQIPSSPRKAWNEQESRCEVCFTHFSQLKQEAVRLVLTCDVSPGSPPSLTSLVGSRSLSQSSPPIHLPGSYHLVTPSSSNSAVLASSISNCSTTSSISNVSISSPHPNKHGTKPNTLGVETGSLAHTNPENTWSPAHLSCLNGVTLFPYQV